MNTVCNINSQMMYSDAFVITADKIKIGEVVWRHIRGEIR